MFKITPINNFEIQKSVAEACGTVFRDGHFAYLMTDIDSGRLMGFSQFEIRKDGGVITDLREVPGLNDFEAMFILGRQTMNFIDLCGSHTVYAPKDAADEKLLHAIGLRLCKDGIYYADMTGMFDGKCDGNALKL